MLGVSRDLNDCGENFWHCELRKASGGLNDFEENFWEGENT